MFAAPSSCPNAWGRVHSAVVGPSRTLDECGTTAGWLRFVLLFSSPCDVVCPCMHLRATCCMHRCVLVLWCVSVQGP